MNFYTNITLFGPRQIEVANALRQMNYVGIISPTVNGYTVIAAEQCDSDDITNSELLALSLSARFRCPVIVILNKHDGILFYKLYSDGVFLDEYNSSPDYFNIHTSAYFPSVPSGGNAEILCTVLGKLECIIGVEEVLHQLNYAGLELAQERHFDLIEELRMPEFSIWFSYGYILLGCFLQDLTDAELVYIG